VADQPRTERRDRHVRAKVVVVSGSFENWCPQTEPSRSLLQLRGPERLKLEDDRNYAPEAIAVKGNLGVSESRSRPKRPWISTPSSWQKFTRRRIRGTGHREQARDYLSIATSMSREMRMTIGRRTRRKRQRNRI